MSEILTIADLKDLARRRVPKMFFDYTDSGAWTESTYRANEEDFGKIKFRQRVLVDMSNRSLESTMIGEKVAMPVALAPTGLTGMQHADGEMLAAQAAEEFGVPFTLSTMSICSIEDVASATKKPFWFQLYVLRDKDFVLDLIDRAKAAKCSALVLTLDLQILGQRHKDVRNGLSAPPKMTLTNIANIAMRPRWLMGIAGTKRRTFRNIVGHAKGVVVDHGAGRNRRCGRRQDRGAYGWRHPLGSGRAQGALPRRQGHLYRPAVPLRPRRHGQGRGDPGAADHPQGDGHHAGAVRQAP